MILVRYIIICLLLTSCKKESLRSHFGSFSLLTSYWFEQENVGYVFFKLDEDPNRFVKPVWEIKYSSGLDFFEGEYELLDFNEGVHEHLVQPCGAQTCGSFSFKSTERLNSMSLRFRYDEGSEAGISQDVFVQNVSGVSAELYGTFDESNTRVRASFENRFPLGPAHGDVESYGLKRSFEFEKVQLAAIGDEILVESLAESKSAFLFPATFCDGLTSSNDDSFEIEKSDWFLEELSESDMSGACMKAKFLDKSGAIYVDEHAFARKNPVVDEAPLRLESPLVDAVEIPLVLTYCEDTDVYGEVFNATFLEYQKFITGINYSIPDVCFEVGKEVEFKTSLEGVLASKLADAKASVFSVRDFVFVIIFHETLNEQFRYFHDTLAESLGSLVALEGGNASPRLVGGFVYANHTDYYPESPYNKYITWCPQKLPESIIEVGNPYSTENCTATDFGEIKNAVLNFSVPMGPFPTQAQYLQHLQDHGDKGFSKNPDLIFKSALFDSSSFQYGAEQVSVFSGEEVNLQAGEAMRFCGEKEGSFSIAGNFRFFEDINDGLLTVDRFISDAMQRSDVARRYTLATLWELPFHGSAYFTVTGKGAIASIIPFTSSSRERQILGDEKWSVEAWELGNYLQTCRNFCNHPYFDAQMKYQVNRVWADSTELSCISSTIPSP